MEKTEGHSERTKQFKTQGKRIGLWVYKTLKEIGKATVEYTWFIFCFFVFLLGIINGHEIVVGDNVPEIHQLNILSPTRSLVYRRHVLAQEFNDENSWATLQPALKILDEVCPEISEWVRNRYSSKKLIWKNDGATYATYDVIDHLLKIDHLTLCQSNGEIAIVLAHEFRHSRQSYGNFLKGVIAVMIQPKALERISENDAYLFEYQVRDAIFH